MARVLVYSMEAPRTRLLELEAPKHTPSLLEVEAPLGTLLDIECIVALSKLRL
jgi:hypothetical protein